MNSRQDYEAALKNVGDAIRRWNLYSLIDSEALADEFDEEIAKVVAKLLGASRRTDVANVLVEVFSESFGEPFASQDVQEAANEIQSGLLHAGLISNSVR
jgi:hypothetical protein